jgi:hypothetical protein
MAFSLSTFQTQMGSGGARPSLFSFSVTGLTDSGLDDLSFMCNVSELPGLSITPIERQYYGRTVKIPGDMVFADLTTTIINDENMGLRTGIEKWMARMNSHESNTRGFGAWGKEGATGTLTQYGKSPTTVSADATTSIYKVNFVGLFPQTLGEIALSYDSASEIEQFDVTWGYQYWDQV